MKRIELWRWRYYDPVRKKHSVTGFVLGEADAAVQCPDGCEKVEDSLEVRHVPETDAERAAGSTSAWQRGGRWTVERLIVERGLVWCGSSGVARLPTDPSPREVGSAQGAGAISSVRS